MLTAGEESLVAGGGVGRRYVTSAPGSPPLRLFRIQNDTFGIISRQMTTRGSSELRSSVGSSRS